MNFVGVIGSLCFAFCLLPQVIKAYRERSANGLSWVFLWLSILGNVACCWYVVYTNVITGVYQFPLYFNYGFALVLCGLLVFAKIRFRFEFPESIVIDDPKDLKELKEILDRYKNAPCKVESFDFGDEHEILKNAHAQVLKENAELKEQILAFEKFLDEQGDAIKETMKS